MTTETTVSPEQLQLVRTSLFNTVHAKYHEFINVIRNLPIHQQCFHQAFIEFDTGILWAKEAVFNGTLIQPEPAPTPTSGEQDAGIHQDAVVLDVAESADAA